MPNNTALRDIRKSRAAVFNTLSHYRRLEIFHALLTAHPNALTYGQLMAQTNMPANCLSHHIRVMRKGRLIVAKPQANKTWFSLSLGASRQLFQQFMLTTAACQPTATAA